MATIHNALYKATIKYPYYGRGFAALTPVEKEIRINGEYTIGIDKYWRIYWSEKALEKYKYHLEDVMCHELEHLLREHAERCESRDPRPWNFATDAEINDDLTELPSDCVTPSLLKLEDGKTAEYYYDNLPESEDESEDGDGDDEDSDDEDSDDNDGSSEGSGVTGKQEKWELKEEQKDGNGKDITSVSKEESESLKDEIAASVVEYANKNAGNVPDGRLLWAKARAVGKMPQISWKRAISSRLQRIMKGREDWAYSKVSRRQPRNQPFLLPVSIAYEPSISVVIDTSGSMYDCADWVAGILKDISKFQANVTLVDCDVEVQGKRALKSWRDVLKSRGGGGTDMRNGIDAAKKSDFIIVLTDGYTPWPEPWPRNCVALIPKEDMKTARIYTGK